MSVETVAALINSFLPEPHASLVNGITFGIDLDRNSQFYEDLKIVGLVHIVVLSGMNISLLSALVIQLLLPLGRQAALILSIAAIVGFVSFVGADPPILRAAVMGGLVLLGSALGKKPIPLYILGITGIILLVLHPEWISSPSFQLSFAATTGILLFANPQITDADDRNPVTIIRKYVMTELRTSLAAQAFTTPIIWWHFEQVSFISPVANIIVSWTIAPIMIIGSCAAVLGSINWTVGFCISLLSYPLVAVIVQTTTWLARIPFAAWGVE